MAFEAAISSAPSVADDVMQRVRDKPIPVRRRRWTRSPATAVCAVAVVCLLGVTIAGWIVAGSRDSAHVALNSGSQQTTEHVDKSHELAQEQENRPQAMTRPDVTGGTAPTAIDGDTLNPRPSPEQMPGAAGHLGRSRQAFGRNFEDSPRAGDVQRDCDGDMVEEDRDRHGVQPGIVVSTQPGNAAGETRAGSPRDGRAGEHRPADSVNMGITAEYRMGDMQLGETLPKRHPAEPADGLTAAGEGPPAESNLSKSEAIRLAAKCIRDAEPNLNLKLDAESAVARYYHKAKAYNGNSLWLVGFPETGREVKKDGDEKNRQAVLYRMVWAQEDGSYSGNCLGELPPTKPPVRFGPQREAKVIQYAKDFVLRHYPKRVGQWLPTATFNTDNRSFGGGPLWIAGFEFKADPPTGIKEVIGPPSVQAVWVTPDGAVMLGPAVQMGPTIYVPKDDADTEEPETPNPSSHSAEPAEEDGERGAAKSKAASWGEAVDGLQCRLHVEKTTLKAGQWPRLLVDMKNGGKRTLTLGEAPDFWELECDGAWYRPAVWFTGYDKTLEMTPSKTHHGFPLMLAKRWTWRAKDGGQPLVFEPGRHVLRVALQLAPKYRGNQWPRLLSNSVEIEVVGQSEIVGDTTSSGSATERGSAEPIVRTETSGGWTDIERVMASLRSEFAKIGSAYPELPDADAVRITRTDVFYGLKYIRNCTHLGRRGHEATGPHPAHIRFEVYSLSEQGDPIAYAVRKPDHKWDNLRLVGWTRVYVGKDASPGFAEKARRIIDQHVAMVDALDRRAKDTPPPVAKDWGWAVEGVQFRLHPDKSSWPQGTRPELLADFRNQGTRDLRIALENESWRLEIDGKWHRPNTGNTGERRWLPLEPGQYQPNFPIWIGIDDNLDRKLRELKPGKHTLRVARHLTRLRVVSNPIEIKILPNQPADD